MPQRAATPITIDRVSVGAVRRTVVIAGVVRDAMSGDGVAGAQVVLRGAGGDATASTDRSGAFVIEVARGRYRAFASADRFVAIATHELDAHDDVHDLDLTVSPASVVTGRVVDRDGRPVDDALVTATGWELGARPLLGTDVARTSADGRYALLLPHDDYEIAARHPTRGLFRPRELVTLDGGDLVYDMTLVAGCRISGRVTGLPEDAAAVLERWSFETLDVEYDAVVDVAADGTFTWTTAEVGYVRLRASSAGSASSDRGFHCRDGVTFDAVVFELGDPDASAQNT